MRILLIFLDGVGIGPDDPTTNPFSTANTPTLLALTNGKRWVMGIGTQRSQRAVFIPTDPQMGIPGKPQSGTGHATIITGKNIPQLIGKHYGPKPDAATRAIVGQGAFFEEVRAQGQSAALLTAYPPRLLYDIERGKRLPTSFQKAAMQAGLPLLTVDDLRAGRALSADWTGKGWHDYLGFPDVPLLSPFNAGVRMAQLAQQVDFAVFTHLFTDYIGHRGTLPDAVHALEQIDTVLAGALSAWDDENGLMILTSDHGNFEAIGSRHHTENPVPTLVIGDEKTAFQQDYNTLADLVPTMRQVLFH